MRRSLILGLVLAFGFLVGQAVSKDETRPPEDAIEALEKYGKPGPEHAWLKRLEGNYEVRLKATMDPSQPMREAAGRAEEKLIFGGLFLQEEIHGTCPFTGKPLHGVAYFGFDNATKKYVSCYLDSLGSGILLYEGTADAAGKVVTLHGTRPNVITGEAMKVRAVVTIVDDTTSTYQEFVPDKTGREFLALEMTYIKKGGEKP